MPNYFGPRLRRDDFVKKKVTVDISRCDQEYITRYAYCQYSGKKLERPISVGGLITSAAANH